MKNVMLEQVKEMLDLQEELEISINGSNWRKLNHSYELCIYMECNEIIDHIGWKHWKKINKPNLDVIAMEVIDVWHFILALWLFKNETAESLAELINDSEIKTDLPIIHAALGLAVSVIMDSVIPFGNFISLCAYCQMDFAQLYRLYIAKHMLNKFRQNNGYKIGTYIKVWDGQDDTDHLIELANKLGTDFTALRLYQCLEFRYSLLNKIPIS